MVLKQLSGMPQLVAALAYIVVIIDLAIFHVFRPNSLMASYFAWLERIVFYHVSIY